MKIDLDPSMMQVSMGLWRQATDMEIDLAPEIRSHILSRRGKILSGFVKVASNWLTVLQACTATGEDLIQLQALVAEIEGFKAWAEAGIGEIQRLANE